MYKIVEQTVKGLNMIFEIYLYFNENNIVFLICEFHS